MLGSTFYHETVRKYVAVFGTLFNDIDVERKDSAGTVTEKIKVPLAYGPKQKWLLAMQETTTARKVTAARVPRMGFSLTGISYDSTRKLNTLGRNVAANTAAGNTTLLTQYNPVPYNFDFDLFVLVKNAADGTQILEQILPYFTPEFTVTVNTIPEMGIKADLPIVLNSASVSDEYEGELATRRTIIWTLSFTLRGYIYPDIKTGSVIKTIEVNFRIPANSASDFDPEYIIYEDSIPDTTNHILLDGYMVGTTRYTDTTRVLNESSDEAVTDAPIKTRYTVVPSPTTAVASEDYGFSETFEFFEPSVENDPATGGDIT